MTAYWIARVDVSDPDAYGEYARRAGPAIAAHGGTFLARGGRAVPLEGREFARNVIVRFESVDAAIACYNSPEYQDALSYQRGAAVRDVCIVEGIE
jgi:uncharacterized protein (DUF1330 family)